MILHYIIILEAPRSSPASPGAPRGKPSGRQGSVNKDYVYIYVYIHTHIHTYHIHMYIYIYTHIQLYIDIPQENVFEMFDSIEGIKKYIIDNHEKMSFMILFDDFKQGHVSFTAIFHTMNFQTENT